MSTTETTTEENTMMNVKFDLREYECVWSAGGEEDAGFVAIRVDATGSDDADWLESDVVATSVAQAQDIARMLIDQHEDASEEMTMKTEIVSPGRQQGGDVVRVGDHVIVDGVQTGTPSPVRGLTGVVTHLCDHVTGRVYVTLALPGGYSDSVAADRIWINSRASS